MHRYPVEDDDACEQYLPGPAEHGVQAEEPLVENAPGRHAWHEADELAPVVAKYLPLLQLVHAADPVDAL